MVPTPVGSVLVDEQPVVGCQALSCTASSGPDHLRLVYCVRHKHRVRMIGGMAVFNGCRFYQGPFGRADHRGLSGQRWYGVLHIYCRLVVLSSRGGDYYSFICGGHTGMRGNGEMEQSTQFSITST